MESMAQRGLVSLLYGRKEKKEKNRKEDKRKERKNERKKEKLEENCSVTVKKKPSFLQNSDKLEKERKIED